MCPEIGSLTSGGGDGERHSPRAVCLLCTRRHFRVTQRFKNSKIHEAVHIGRKVLKAGVQMLSDVLNEVFNNVCKITTTKDCCSFQYSLGILCRVIANCVHIPQAWRIITVGAWLNTNACTGGATNHRVPLVTRAMPSYTFPLHYDAGSTWQRPHRKA